MKAWLERLLLTTGRCYRCNRPWITKATKNLGVKDGVHHSRQLKRDAWWGLLGVRYHVTDVTDNKGMFPLCENCWRELRTAEARRPYYMRLWHRWCNDGIDTDPSDPQAITWPRIVDALQREETSL